MTNHTSALPTSNSHRLIATTQQSERSAVEHPSNIVRQEQHLAAEAIQAALAELNLPECPLGLRPLPFAGSWGIASSVCHAIAGEMVEREFEADERVPLSRKDRKRRVAEAAAPRAQEIAAQVAARVAVRGRFARVEATKGYVNIYFDASAVAARLISEVLRRGHAYGRGEPRAERVMVEHSQPNTHKAFHVGHLRNVCLGVAVSNIIAAAGYPLLQATYPGDIGMHVIKCLWCYERFHQGDEPADPTARGRWLGDIYAEADARLEFRKHVRGFLVSLAAQIGDQPPLRDDDIPQWWAQVGVRLRESVPLRQWEDLDAHMADWWPRVPVWRDEVRETFQRWERQDPAFVALWRETREWSLADFRRIFAELGATFDVWFFESEMEAPGRQIVQELLEVGIAEYSVLPEHNQAPLPVVKIDEKLGLAQETYRTMPILRSDGTTLYATKDLALTKIKFERYGVERAVWVVDVRQSLYFQQIFKILELWGFAQARDAHHLAYDMVVLPEGVISSRQGNVPLYDDIRDAVRARARTIVEEKNPGLPAEVKSRVAWQVAIGSLKYAMLARDNTKTITFDLEEALSFDGNTAPYIQYAHARACRILEHAGVDDADLIATLGTLDLGQATPGELSLLQQVAALPDEVQRAAAEFRPLLIANYIYELAQRFNDFYHACPVLQSAEPTRTARLALVAATRITMANGLALLGIEAPVTM